MPFKCYWLSHNFKHSLFRIIFPFDKENLEQSNGWSFGNTTFGKTVHVPWKDLQLKFFFKDMLKGDAVELHELLRVQTAEYYQV